MAASVPNINGFTPQVIEERQMNVVGMDVFSRLMMDRIIFMGVPVNDYVANVIQAHKRTCLQHSRVMIHQPSGGMQGQFTDMEISYNLIKQLRDELYDIMAHHTGKTFDEIEKDSMRDNWMTAAEAKEYGLVDEVLDRKNPRKKEA